LKRSFPHQTSVFNFRISIDNHEFSLSINIVLVICEGAIIVTYYERKEANRYYWQVKGQLIPECWSEEKVKKIHKSYFRRLQLNQKTTTRRMGFESAWSLRQANITIS